jgi:hypothetical protein
LFVLFQPIFYLIYKKWQKERELERGEEWN